jgi:hypothetical protein
MAGGSSRIDAEVAADMPRFPWPPLEETVVTAVDRLLGPVH